MAGPGRSIPFDRVADRYDETRGGARRGREVAAEVASSLLPGRAALEVGVGTGLVAAGLQELGWTVVGVDLSPGMLGRAAALVGPVVAVADAHVLPVPAASVDNVYIVWVLHVVADAAAVLRECARVLRPGGRLVVVPAHADTDDDITPFEHRLFVLRTGQDDRDTILTGAAAAGLTLVETRELVGEFDMSPSEVVRHLEARTTSFLWDVSDETWAAVVQPVIDDVKTMPDPDRPRHRVSRREVFVFNQPVDKGPPPS